MNNLETVPPPLSVRLVAYLFLFAGYISAFNLILEWVNGNEGVNLAHLIGILPIAIGYGLLQRRSNWRIIAIIVLVIQLVYYGFVLVYTIFSQAGSGYFNSPMLNIVRMPVSKGIGILIASVVLFIKLWQVAILFKPETRRFFRPVQEKQLNEPV